MCASLGPVLGRSAMPKKAVRTSSWRRLERVQLCAFACNPTAALAHSAARKCAVYVVCAFSHSHAAPSQAAVSAVV